MEIKIVVQKRWLMHTPEICPLSEHC